jgi:uncharacterized protein (DUF4415 family)
VTKLKKIAPLSDAEEAHLQRLIAEDPEDGDATDDDIAKARPFAEAFPELAASIKRGRGRPRAEHPKEQVTMRLDADVIEGLRSSGPGWQVRVNALLREHLDRSAAARHKSRQHQ